MIRCETETAVFRCVVIVVVIFAQEWLIHNNLVRLDRH